MNSNFYNKYLKYKSKYLELKNIKYNQIGGDLPIITDPYIINLFTDPEMERYMNPIHGCVLCNTGEISNIYWLNKDKLIREDLIDFLDVNELQNLKKKGQLIGKVCKIIFETVKPTKNLLALKPIDYGRYIALKYINMINSNEFIILSKQGNIQIEGIQDEDRQKIVEYLKKIRIYIPFIDDDLFTFHIILYCLWWVSNDDNGIEEYYCGISEIFTLLGEYSDKVSSEQPKKGKIKKKLSIPTFKQTKNTNPNSFEKILLEITTEKYKIYSLGNPLHFCDDEKEPTYVNCIEVTSLNLINLIIFDNSTLNIQFLSKNFNPIPELLEFYRVFKNFNQISNINYKPEIFCHFMNAQDAWSYLIINFANSNLKFKNIPANKKCLPYEVKSSASNFLQLIKNLLGIENWENLNKDNLEIIDNITDKDIGNIYINHNEYGEFTINILEGHIEMNNNLEIEDISIDISLLTQEQQTIINIINLSIFSIRENALKYNFDYKSLVNLFFYNPKIIFILSLTNKYNSYSRKNININVVQSYFDWIIEKFIKEFNQKLQEYTYECFDFEFIRKMPLFKHLNSNITYYRQIIDPSPLENIESLGNNFMSNYTSLISIDLSQLNKLTSIGNNFMSNCSSLKSIILPKNLTSFEYSFLYYCYSLPTLNLSNLTCLESIKSMFLRFLMVPLAGASIKFILLLGIPFKIKFFLAN